MSAYPYNNRKSSTHSAYNDEKDFNSSCCDYNSDVFKEQPSQIDYSQISALKLKNQMMSDDEDGIENFVISPVSNKAPSGQIDTNHSLRMHMIQGKKGLTTLHTGNYNTHLNSNTNISQAATNRVNTQGIQSVQNQNISKVSCEQSFHYPRSQNGTAQGFIKHQKKPLYSLVPDHIQKNLPKDFNMKHQQQQKQQDQDEMYNMKGGNKNNQVLAQDNANMYCEESELMTRNHNHNHHGTNGLNSQSNINLTPNKRQPIPISPSQKPILSQNTSGLQLQQQQQQYSGRQQQQSNNNTCIMCINNPSYRSNSKPAFNNSEQKPSVQYNEFKYYTSGNDINAGDMKKYINISNHCINRKSEIQITGQNYELSPCDHRIFDVSSPLNSGSASSQIRANSLRKQQVSGFSNQIQDNRNYQLQLKQDSLPEGGNFAYEQKIKELQDHIANLENDLRSSQLKNNEMQKKIKDKSFIQSFDKNLKTSKHLSDTEDSLILSEKKAIKRSSISKDGVRYPNQTIQNQSMPQNSQSLSSIVDVKIRPVIENLKHHNQTSPAQKNANQMTFNNQQVNLEEQEVDEEIEYHVGNLSEANQQNSQIEGNNHDEEEECEGCERLKQLVFQAKEAIDDLKGEIEEWRDICSEKETELRQLHHRLYNDLIGTDKKIQFKDEDIIKEFDSNRPVNYESRKIKNFIQQNKKRIMSRQRNKNEKKASTTQYSANKKSALKDIKESIGKGDEIEFFEAEDQGIQTSFVITNDQQYMTTYNDNISARQENCRSDVKLLNNYMSNSTTKSNNMSPLKQMQIYELKENENPTTMITQNDQYEMQKSQCQDEVQTLRTKTYQQDQELLKLRSQLAQVTKQCEQFVNIINKVKRKQKKPQFDLNEIRENFEVVSNIESYSILEKINEWKREEGLECTNLENCQTQIPRPIKLINEIKMEDLEENDLVISQNEGQFSPGKDFRNYIKQEQEQLKKLQELKFKEFQKQQQDYLQYLKGVQ